MKRLVVVVPGYRPAKRKWIALLRRLEQDQDSETVCKWVDHRVGYVSRRPMSQLALELNARIAQWVREADQVDEVILLAHSLGGPIARSAYLMAAGAYGTPIDADSWAPRVSRLVLLASVNRGLEFEGLGIILQPTAKFLLATGLLRLLTLNDCIRGSTFMTDLRIRWIRHFSRLGDRAPVVTQLLGTGDRLVRREDSLDVEQFPNAHHKDVPGATHLDIYQLEGVENTEDRLHLIREAVMGRAFPCEGKRSVASKSPVVFVLHGIRASNSGWVEQVRSRIQDREPRAEVITASYGWFSALDCAIPFLRRRNIRWFQDQYSYYFARYPESDFHFLGHSNGTYILGQSLASIPAMTFRRVLLVGSVLPQDYPWQDRLDDPPQVEFVRNDRANRDGPVALLVNGLRGLRFGMRDIGASGVNGFNFGDSRITEVFYYDGGHSAALVESNLDDLVDFVLTGTGTDEKKRSLSNTDIDPTFRSLSNLAPTFARLLFVALIAGAWYVSPWALASPTSLGISVLTVLMVVALARSL